MDAAQMFAADCVFRAHAHLSRPDFEASLTDHQLRVIPPAEIRTRFRPIVALDNVAHADSVYGYRVPAGPNRALIVGNERRGISRDLVAVSDSAVQIPMHSRHLNCLNVVAAAAVALYYMSNQASGNLKTLAHPARRRPEILFLAPADHVELGSSIRSAGAFGWQQVMVDDRHGVWFGVARAPRAEGRAAARRSRNPIRVIPSTMERQYAFDDVCVIVPGSAGTSISRANLAGGHRQLLVLPDLDGVDLSTIDWQRFGKRVRFASLNLPVQPDVRHYRLDTSIVLAESARQVGRPPTGPRRTRSSGAPRYDRVLRLGMPNVGEIVYLDDLDGY